MISSTVHEPPHIQRPLLYTYRRCPYAMRARMALLQAGIGFHAHEIALRDKPSDMLRMSPKGTVPVLVLPGQHVVDQSLEIMGWAFHGRDPGGWWDRAQSDLCQELVGLNDGPFKQHLDGYKYPERDPCTLSQKSIAMKPWRACCSRWTGYFPVSVSWGAASRVWPTSPSFPSFGSIAPWT